MHWPCPCVHPSSVCLFIHWSNTNIVVTLISGTLEQNGFIFGQYLDLLVAICEHYLKVRHLLPALNLSLLLTLWASIVLMGKYVSWIVCEFGFFLGSWWNLTNMKMWCDVIGQWDNYPSSSNEVEISNYRQLCGLQQWKKM